MAGTPRVSDSRKQGPVQVGSELFPYRHGTGGGAQGAVAQLPTLGTLSPGSLTCPHLGQLTRLFLSTW